MAIRMGRLADSSLGARYLGVNPWVVVAAPAYLARRGAPAYAGRAGAPRRADLQHRAGRRPLAASPAPTAQSPAGAGARAAALEQPVGAAGRGTRRPGPGGPAVVRGPRVGAVAVPCSRCWPSGRCRRRRSTRCSRRRGWCRPRSAASSSGCRGSSASAGGCGRIRPQAPRPTATEPSHPAWRALTTC